MILTNTKQCISIDIEKICNAGIDLDPFSYDFVPGYPTLDFLSTKGFDSKQTNLLFDVKRPVGIYIHIPFCDYFCDYCYFVKYKAKKETIERYIDSIIKELTLYSIHLSNTSIGYCYIGGGTPTSIPNDLLQKLIQFFYKNFKVTDDFEFTCEASPNTLTKDVISNLRSIGITRMSIGIQSFNADILRSMGRRYSRKYVEDITQQLHKYFPESFNYDFIFGYHLHTLDTVKEDVELVTKLGIPSVTFYQIWLKRETDVKQKIKTLNYSDIYSQRFLINEVLSSNGYVNDKSDWFINSPKAKYKFQDHKWQNGFFYGVGINSYGFANNFAYRNFLEISDYLKHDFSKLPINNFYQLTRDDLEKREVCLSIKLQDGIDLKRISNPQLKSKIMKLIDFGLAEKKEAKVQLKPVGFSITEYISNYLIS